jgi:predicted  nucleic acid-binding Zn-ribbon protein
LKEQLLLLIELQNVDSAVGRINIKKKELPDKIAKLDEAFTTYKENFENRVKAVEDLKKKLKEKEEKLKRGVETLKKTKDRLLEVKTNKEYQAVLKEIEGIEIKNSEYEDEIIITMEEIDRSKTGFQQVEQEMEAYRLKHQKERDGFEKELAMTDSELAGCQEKAAVLRTKVEPEVLKRYEIIRNRNNGLAVVAVWKEVCRGCHMNIPPQLYNELLTATTLLSCPNCNRIMYPENPDKNEK